MADKRALKTLFATYWSSAGWRPEDERIAASDEFEHAKRAGIMFEPIHADHASVIARLVRVRDALTVRRVADAFLASLSSHSLELRSALGSYSVFRHMAPHATTKEEKRCAKCGFYVGWTEPEDLNILNFERFKWGGVRHDQPLYAAFDLELFAREPTPIVTDEDARCFRAIIASIEDSPMSMTSANLHTRIGNTLKSNKAERDGIIAILGFCGVIQTTEHRGYQTEFVDVNRRELPDRRFVDMSYPACWWRRVDGLNEYALRDYFGHVLE